MESYTHYTVKEYIELLSSLFSPKIAAKLQSSGILSDCFSSIIAFVSEELQKEED